MGCSIMVLILLAVAIFVNSSTRRPTTEFDQDAPVWHPEAHVKFYKKTIDTKSASFKRTTRLYSKTSGNHVRINQTGRVDGAGKEFSDLAKLSIESVTFGKVKIRGVKSGLYLCMNKKGKLVGRKKKNEGKEKRKKCMYTEIEMANGYVRYQSFKYPKWYIAINRKGKTIPRRKRLKARQFLQRHYVNIKIGRRRKAGRARRMKKRRQLARKNRMLS